jgi:hypothetical protein
MPDIIRAIGPARVVTEAINRAHDRGLFVSTARELGVICESTAEPRWIVDARGGRSVSVLGAVLLDRSPAISDIDQALAAVFESRPEFHEGIEDAVAGERDVSRDDLLYRDGVFLGMQIRELIRRRQGVPIEREADEITRKILEPRRE